MRVVAANVQVPGGEIDLLARDGKELVAVEVRTVRHSKDPIEAIDSHKREHVARLASALGVSRIGFVGIGLDEEACVVHWVPQ